MWKKRDGKKILVIFLSLIVTGIVGSCGGAQNVCSSSQAMKTALQMVRDQVDTEWRDTFHTYAEATAELQNLAATYPTLCHLYDLGHSVQGRVVWGLKITDNPDIEENEPEFRICGLHHGNEYMSMEISLLMCSYLLQNYGTIPLVTHLVNEREIWIIPMVNPDGLELHQRYNYNGVDLNRDYGYVWGPGWGSPSPFSQPETRAVRNNAFNNTFGLSLSFHTAALYVNYVWNYKHQRTPDNTLIVQLSNAYAAYNGYTVVEGYDWYQTRGDTNDFSYGCRGDMDWTIETQGSNIPQVWGYNRDAILEMMNSEDIGLKGIVTDAVTGAPLKATVWVDQVYWPCYTDSAVGDYHRLLLPGYYTVHFRANGYQEQTYNVHIANSTPVVLNVALTPGGNRYAYQVFWANIYDPYPQASGNNFVNNPTEVISSLGPTDGKFASLGKGGSVCLDMAESGEILNGPGVDFTVTEGETPEGYTVYVSQTGEWGGTWVSLGSATGTASFDLATGGVQKARYVKIADDNVGSATETNPGFDLNSVQVIHAVQDPLVLSGDCFYENMTPASPVTVDVVNRNTSHRWQATTVDNHYTLSLTPGIDINAGETLRVIARDTLDNVNVTDHTVSAAEMNAHAITMNLVLSIHYRDLKSFPFYLASGDTGAAVAQMMLNYIWWNSTENPEGPPLYYPDQNVLFTAFNTQGGLYLDGNELYNGLNAYRPLPVDTYGYTFSPTNSTNANVVLKEVCIWLDYNIGFFNQYHASPWPKQGYPYHVPIAVPTYGDYNNWMVVRGIHTNRSAWDAYPDFPPLTVYGFWLNDPKSGGLGGNTYVTAQQFLTTYFKPLTVAGDAYQNNYLAIIEPPQGITVNTNDADVLFAETPEGFSPGEAKLVQTGLQNTGSLRETANNAVVKAARTAVENVLKLDASNLGELFAETTVVGKPVCKDGVGIVTFSNTQGVTFEVHLLIQTGALLQFSVNGL